MKRVGCWRALMLSALLWTLLGTLAGLLWLITRWWLIYVLLGAFALASER